MVCPYCQINTKVKNSRTRGSGYSVWRRRFCANCKISFSTDENISTESIIKIRDHNGNLYTFEYLRLYIDIFKALGGLDQYIEPAKHLSSNCCNKILDLAQPVIEQSDLEKHIFETLNSYNQLAGRRYLINSESQNNT